jgi:lantibiotic modifying enzyme
MTFLEAADRIGARLCRDAIWSGGRCNWIAETMVAEGEFVWCPLGPDLYSGTAGIALFLHHLAEATGEPIFRDTAGGALAQAVSQAGRIPPGYRAGFYMGWGGIAFAAAELGRLDQGAELASVMELSQESDITHGSAGAIAVLLYLGLVDAAIRYGDALLAGAERDDAGLSWCSLSGSESEPLRNLTGFSHGTAGIGWALLELSAATGERRFREAAEDAFRYERSCYDPERRNWPDYRGGSADYVSAWCHGAPGIGFSRIRASQLQPSAGYREEADAALATTESSLAALSGADFSLCHGAAGNADVLLYASQVLGGNGDAAARVMRAGVAEYEVNRKLWPCGLRGAGEVPGLMLGIAGIGYFCLRLTDPSRYPTILLPGLT